MDVRAAQVPQYQLHLTQSLRLSLEVLQMPLAQLHAFLRQQLEDNPVLELLDEGAAEAEPAPPPPVDARSPWKGDGRAVESRRGAEGSSAGRTGDDDGPLEDTPARPPSLHEQVLFQLRCLAVEEPDRRAAEAVAQWLDPDGYLRTPLEEIAQAEGLERSRLERAVRLIQRLDPPGVGARSLAECLLIQLDHRHQAGSLAARIIRDHFQLLARRNVAQLASRLQTSVDEVREACRRIAALDPRPARHAAAEPSLPLVPDLIIHLVEADYEVDLNREGLLSFCLSRRYQALLRAPSTPIDAKRFIRQQLRQATWLMDALGRRNDTLLGIARCLLALEQGFLAHGVSHLTVLTQEDMARLVGCHPSTVSRAIAEKTIQTPYGILPLEAFFGGGLARPEHPEARVSPRAVQAELASLIASEDRSTPLSDHVLAKTLRTRGYPLARRTVAKYRTALKLLPAHLRKRAF